MVERPTDLFFLLSVFWAVIYTLRHYRRRHTWKPTLLPAPPASTRLQPTELFKSRTTLVTLSKFHLRASTTAFNNAHTYFSGGLKHSRWKRALCFAYDVGSVLGLLGMLGSVLLLLWTTVRLVFSNDLLKTPTPPTSPVLHKREEPISEISSSSQSGPTDVPLQLILPGVTTPLHHLPIFLAALSATQIIHEAGHAISAALEYITLGSAGLGFTVLLPSAFVSLSAREIESLSLRSRLRVITSGAYHNILLWLFLTGIGWTNIPHYIWPIFGYQDISAYGRVVLHVEENSPLYGHIPVGAVIIKVGDDTLDGPKGSSIQWETLLSDEPNVQTHSLGWCTSEPAFAAQDAACCDPQTSLDVSLGLACFASLANSSFARCVDPLLYLDDSETRRCSSAIDCGSGFLCVRPRGDQKIISLTMHLPPWLRNRQGADDDVERRVVWQGDPLEILHEVEVGDWLPSRKMLPMSIPVLLGNMFLYLKTLTLSLYFFNLLPLPLLDGGQLLDVICDSWMSKDDDAANREALMLNELEAIPHEYVMQRPSPQGFRKMWLKKAIHLGVGALLACCVLLSLLRNL